MKKLIAFILSASITTAANVSSLDTLAADEKKLTQTSSESCARDLEWKNSNTIYLKINSELKYEATISTSNELEKVNAFGKKEFYKKAKISGIFFNAHTKTSILTNSLEVTFKYDKNRVCIETPKTDVIKNIYSTNKLNWKVSDKEEIFCSPSQCILSQQSTIYQRERWYNLRKTWDYYDNFHIDLICSPTGEIDFNIKSSPHLTEKAFTLKNVSTNYTTVGNGIIRQEKINDYIYNHNEKNDKYNYVTRKTELLYKNAQEKTIAVVKLETNFRYNKETKEAECLSTIHREATISEEDSLYVYSRTGNKTRSEGGSYTIVSLEHHSEDDTLDFNATVKVSCDYNGNIFTEIE